MILDFLDILLTGLVCGSLCFAVICWIFPKELRKLLWIACVTLVCLVGAHERLKVKERINQEKTQAVAERYEELVNEQ